MEIINFNETDFEVNEQDFYTFLMYKGKPFTGKLKDDSEITEFVNGNANGDSLDYYENGQLRNQDVYKNGDSIRSKEWYPNGQLLSDSEFNRVWNSKGRLVKDDDHWLYSNLSPKTKGNYFKEGMTYLTPNGEIAAEELPTETEQHNTIYYDEILTKWYSEMLLNPCPELSPDSYYTNSNTRFIWGWIWNVFQENPEQSESILATIQKHENEKIAEEAKEMAIDLKSPNFNYIKARWL